MEAESGPTVSSEQLECAEQYRRRRATAVLCPVFGDIIDSTSLLEEIGEDEYDELRKVHDRTLREIIEGDGGGALLQTYGDGFLAVFSEPSTAVERCLDIQHRLEEARQVRGRRRSFRLRIGVDMGQVAVKRASGIVAEIFGRHVNRASRIESQAKPGTVLTSFTVYDSSVGWLRNAVKWTHHPPVHLKGFADPISLHEPAPISRRDLLEETLSPRSAPARTPPEFHRTSSVISGDPLEEALRSIRRAGRPRILRAFSKRRILWVDDCPENNRELEKKLADAGLETENALDTRAALAALRRARFAAVISDMRRGEISTAGLELIDRVRASEIRVPCLIFTSPELEAEHGEEATRLGARICTSGAVSLLRALAEVLPTS